jgi:membrane-associated phospholipid phosphatase
VSVNGGVKRVAERPAAWLQRLGLNAASQGALLGRKPRFTATPAWRVPGRLGVGAAAVIVVIAATMILVDAWAVGAVQRLPERLIEIFDYITDFGKSLWFLVPIAVALAAMGLLASPALPRMSARVLAAVAVRLGFLFLAIGLPGLTFTVVKRLIGRARPLVEGGADPFIYRPLGMRVEYASLPSGHSIDAFAAAMAIGLLWPRMRPLLWTYAVVIAVSRVVLTAHFPSDVMAGAVVGVVGVLLVRDWFAARGLAFVVGRDGTVLPLPGPSFARVRRVARQLIAP